MNKQDIVGKIARDTGLTKASAAAAIDSLIDTITKSLKKGEPVSFVGFGTFKISNRKARTARNPQTGEPIKIPKRRSSRRLGSESGEPDPAMTALAHLYSKL